MNALIIFAKNPIPGRVKTRIAVESSPEIACKIYREIMEYTFDTMKDLNVDKYIYWDEIPNLNISPSMNYFHHKLQSKGDLGERIKNSLVENFKIYRHIILIGSDCPYLKLEDVELSFFKLKSKNSLVIGPCYDGGYYLIGMSEYREELFTNIPWSTETVLGKTISIANGLGYEIDFLSVLHDIDDLSDYINYSNIIKK